MASDLDQTITTLEQEISNLRVPMMTTHVKFVRAASAWAGRIWPEYAQTTVTRDAHLARRLVAEGRLAHVKQRVQALTDEALELATEEIALAQQGWPHLAEDMTALEDGDYNGVSKWLSGPRSRFRVDERHGRQVPPSAVTHATSALLSRVQSLLREYGFETTYMHYDWDADMLDLIREYAAKHEALMTKRHELDEARRKRDQNEAADLWNAA